MIEDASDWFMLKKNSWGDFAAFRDDFVNTYWSDDTQRKVRHRIGSSRWEPGTSMFTHFTFYYRLGISLTRNMDEIDLIALIMEHFPTDTRNHFMNLTDKTLNPVLEFLRRQAVADLKERFEAAAQGPTNKKGPLFT